MVLGLRTKSRKGSFHQLVYTVNVKEINPWSPLRSAQSVLLQWENGDQSSGVLTSAIDNGKIEFDESFQLIFTLEASRKSTNRESFIKNCLEFHLYEPKKDKVSKGQLLGSAIVNLAVYGILKETASISIPFNMKRSSRNIEQPVLYLNIQPCEKDSPSSSTKGGLSKEVSLDKDGSESVSESINEGNDKETEIAYFTDEDDDDLSSRSSQTISSSVFDHSRESHIQHDENGSESTTGGIESLGVTIPSSGACTNSGITPAVEAFKHVDRRTNTSSLIDLLSDPKNLVTNPMAKVASSETSVTIPIDTNLDHVKDTGLSSNPENPVTYPAEVASSEMSVTISVDTNLYHVKDKDFSSNPKNLLTYPANVASSETSVTIPVDTNLDNVKETDLSSNPKNHVTYPAKVASSETSVSIPVDTNLDHVKDKDLSLNLKNSLTYPMFEVKSSEASNTIPVDMNLDNVKDKDSHTKRESDRKSWWHDQSHVDRSLSSISQIGHWKGNEEKTLWEDELDSQILNADEYSLQDRLGFIPAQDSTGKKITSRSNTFASFLETTEVKGGLVANNRQKHVAPLQSHFDKAKSNGVTKKIQFVEKEKENGIPEDIPNDNTSDMHSEREETSNIQFMEKAKEPDIPEKMHNGSTNDTCNESEENANSFSIGKLELESKIEMLEEELREAAVVEASLYSVIAEHGGSTNKVHAPARRLSRFYIHACRTGNTVKRASAARAAVSGLVLVSKACGNDVPRLTFWFSNSIVLRAIVSHAIGEMVFEDTSRPQETLTPHMQSDAAKSSISRKTSTRRYGLGDQEQGNFSIELWKKAFKDVCERLCPIRAYGHECGCLSVLAKSVIEQLVGRLDVAMFNAILRESADEMPTDPVSDPICDSKVLPIPAGKSSFGAGVQLKNAIGNWSRWLTDLFGIDDNDVPEDSNEVGNEKNAGYEASFKTFCLLNALSDLMMLPPDMLADPSTQKEVCPKFGAPLIIRALNNFVPDEFNPNPVPAAVFEALEENISEAVDESITNFPCMANPTVYSPPSAASLTGIIGLIGNQALQRSRSSVLRKSYTSDDELDELDSPISSIIIENPRDSTTAKGPNWMRTGEGGRKVVRYQLIREIWKDGE
ncbi:Thioredoxin O2, putative isoform 1 [Hibiscus syriacus]|uniref:Thioredoxin O2, putative isoform 1 n=1 Tax=Hibiscus syriacus TaxID=106335 RepID=A0A6A3AUA9_HIBSY|nr:Thioredoxin O2, putative isoform 1 [Hibiscus syriacus]